jgi:hypothetical protein
MGPAYRPGNHVLKRPADSRLPSVPRKEDALAAVFPKPWVVVLDSVRAGLAKAVKLLAILDGAVLAVSVLLALLVGAGVYRLRLALALQDATSGWAGEPVAAAAVFRQLGADALLALSVALLVQAVVLSAAPRKGSERSLSTVVRSGAGWLLLSLLLLTWGLACQSHYSTLLAMGTGLTAELLRESLNPAALREAAALLLPYEVALLMLPLLMTVLLTIGLRRWQRFYPVRWLGGLLLLLVPGLVGLGELQSVEPLPKAMLHHPVGFVVAELLHSRNTRQPHSPMALVGGTAHAAAATAVAAPVVSDAEPAAGDPSDAPEDAPTDDAAVLTGAPLELPLALTSPLFAHPVSERPIRKRLPALSASAPKAFNIVVILMESTGFDYALKPVGDAGVAMPFLQSLTQRGYFLANHYSPGNSSPRGIASLLSGLYVLPEVGIFDVRKDNHLPSLTSYLGARYQRFLVTPASLDWYFPHAFLQHSGWSELFGYHALPIRKNAPGGRSHARDEAETVSFFLQRLTTAATEAAGNPFVGVYYSFVAHWPYPDYGEATHFQKPIRPLNAYLNNLRYLDQQIERIFIKAKELNLDQNTIFVIAGDHGEGFGQHPHNYTHSRQSYNENYRTPALIINPQLFPPKVITAPTSHVDILPTLLDALGVAYDSRRLQGESLFQEQLSRKYIFLYGNENTVSSISEDQIKLQISFKDKSCWAFDLKVDSGENKRLKCDAYNEQRLALIEYRKNQQIALRRYNAQMQALPPGSPPPALPTQQVRASADGAQDAGPVATVAQQTGRQRAN